jgi:hypothetical protein
MDATLTWPKALLAVIACVLLYAWLFGFPAADGPQPERTPAAPAAVQPETPPADPGPSTPPADPA